jgi:hypothetical protein
VQADDRWNAEVRTLRLFTRDKPHVETVTVPESARGSRRAQRPDLGAPLD